VYYPWGSGLTNCTRLNYDHWHGVCVGDTSQVGDYTTGASPYGAMDMSGNVSEWVNDWYRYNYYQVSPPSNPPGPPSGGGKVTRGGGWGHGSYTTMVFARDSLSPWVHDLSTGFRCVMTPSGE
jgi:formylglycine-generating enzyme required for sulfatase activity